MGRIGVPKIDKILRFLFFPSVGILLGVLSTHVASAADVYQMPLLTEINVISVAGSGQYAICDTCPAITQLNENVVEERKPIKIAIRFSEKPDILQRAGHLVPVMEERKKSGPLLTVNFDLNSAQVRGGETKKIEGAVPSLRTKAPLTIIGYTCELGSQVHNDKLALRRAQAVRNVLLRNGLRRDDIASVEGKGKCCFVDTYPARHFVNRRVEIRSQQ